MMVTISLDDQIKTLKVKVAQNTRMIGEYLTVYNNLYDTICSEDFHSMDKKCKNNTLRKIIYYNNLIDVHTIIRNNLLDEVKQLELEKEDEEND